MWQKTMRGRKYNLETQELQCVECGEIKSFDDFYHESKGIVQRTGKCKSCLSKIKSNKYYLKNPKYKVIDGIKCTRHSGHYGTVYYNEELKVKTCNTCGKLLPKSAFYYANDNILRLSTSCKKCSTCATPSRLRFLKSEKGIESSIKTSLVANIRRIIKDDSKYEVTFDKDTLKLLHLLNKEERDLRKYMKQDITTEVKRINPVLNSGIKPHHTLFKVYSKLS